MNIEFLGIKAMRENDTGDKIDAHIEAYNIHKKK